MTTVITFDPRTAGDRPALHLSSDDRVTYSPQSGLAHCTHYEYSEGSGLVPRLLTAGADDASHVLRLIAVDGERVAAWIPRHKRGKSHTAVLLNRATRYVIGERLVQMFAGTRAAPSKGRAVVRTTATHRNTARASQRAAQRAAMVTTHSDTVAADLAAAGDAAMLLTAGGMLTRAGDTVVVTFTERPFAQRPAASGRTLHRWLTAQRAAWQAQRAAAHLEVHALTLASTTAAVVEGD